MCAPHPLSWLELSHTPFESFVFIWTQSTAPESSTPPEKRKAKRANTEHTLQVPQLNDNTSSSYASSPSTSTTSAAGGLSNSTPNLYEDGELQEGGLPGCRYSVANPAHIVACEDHVEEPQDDVELVRSASQDGSNQNQQLPKIRIEDKDGASSSSASSSDDKQEQESL